MSTLKEAVATASQIAYGVRALSIEATSAWAEMSMFWPTIALNLAPGPLDLCPVRPILILPGFTATDGSLVFLVTALKALGYHPYTWEQGRNHGRFEELLPGILETFFEIHREHKCPVELIGWSKGGRMALKLANILGQEYVSGVVTIGSPILPNSGRSVDDIPSFLEEDSYGVIDKVVYGVSEKLGLGLQEIKRDIRCIIEELQNPAPMPPDNVPYTAILGSLDMVVPEEDALISEELLCEHVQNQIVLWCGHLGLGLSGRTIVEIVLHIQNDYENYYEHHELVVA